MGTDSYILVCDDNQAIAKSIVILLESAGYRAVAVSSALDCVASARQAPPDLILMDIMMPGMDGATVSGLMKDVPGLERIPIVLLSAMPEEEVRRRAIEAEAVDYLLKPFSKSRLVDVIRRRTPEPETALIPNTAEPAVS